MYYLCMPESSHEIEIFGFRWSCWQLSWLPFHDGHFLVSSYFAVELLRKVKQFFAISLCFLKTFSSAARYNKCIIWFSC
jgi:hypothetical protein